MPDAVETINSQGWVHLTSWDGRDAGGLTAQLPDLFEDHPIGSSPSTLQARGKVSAKPGTMSSIIGLNQQPPHTDKAHVAAPPRFVILHCEDPGEETCPTLLWQLDWRALEAEPPALLTSPSWLIRRSAHDQFYGQILDFTSDRKGMVRFDPLCMLIPSCPSAVADAQKMLLSNSHLSSFKWRCGDTLVIDNWRVLHARGALQAGKSTRRLSRWISGEGGGLGSRKTERKSPPVWATRA